MTYSHFYIKAELIKLLYKKNDTFVEKMTIRAIKFNIVILKLLPLTFIISGNSATDPFVLLFILQCIFYFKNYPCILVHTFVSN